MKKRNLALIISLAVLGVIGVIALTLAYVIQGVNIWAWFGSKWGITILICIGVYAIIVLILLINDWRKTL